MCIRDSCPVGLIVGFSFTALGFLLFFGPVSVVTSYRKVRREGVRGCAALGGGLLLLGLIWVAIGGVLLLSGEDIYCSWYTLSDTKCGAHGVCFGGSCECEPGYHGELCAEPGQPPGQRCTAKQMRDVAMGGVFALNPSECAAIGLAAPVSYTHLTLPTKA